MTPSHPTAAATCGKARPGRLAFALRALRSPLVRARCGSFSDSLLPPRGLRRGQGESPLMEDRQSGPLLAPSMVNEGPREDQEGHIRDGTSSERSDCTSHDGPFPRLRSGQAFGRCAMCLVEPLRSDGLNLTGPNQGTASRNTEDLGQAGSDMHGHLRV